MIANSEVQIAFLLGLLKSYDERTDGTLRADARTDPKKVKIRGKKAPTKWEPRGRYLICRKMNGRT